MEKCEKCKAELYEQDQYIWDGQILCWNCLMKAIKAAQIRRLQCEK